MRFSDPALCPDCREPLPPSPQGCPRCGLPLQHPLSSELLVTLRRADGLLGELREVQRSAQRAAVPVTATQPAAPRPVAPRPVAHRPGAPAPLPPAPVVPPLVLPADGVRASSVPRLLLGLGALCLLVAAVVFLAVSWRYLGVSGRTLVLAGLTALAGGSATLALRHGLRVAAEALSLVALGLLALDVTGAAAAGWLGDIGGAGTAVATGLVVLLTASTLSLAPLAAKPLVSPQVVAGLALSVTYVGAVQVLPHLLAGHLVIAAASAVALAGRARGTTTLIAAAGTAAALAWLPTTLAAGFSLLAEPTLANTWGGGDGWSLLVSAGWLVAPAVLLPRLLAPAVGAASLIVAGTVLLPAVDESGTVIGLSLMATAALALVALITLPTHARPAAMPLAALSGLGLGLGSAGVAVDALRRWSELADLGVLRRTLATAPAPTTSYDAVPGTFPAWLVAPALVMVVLLLAAALQRRPAPRLWAVPTALAGVLGAVAALGVSGIALAAPVGLLALTSLALAAAALGAFGPAPTTRSGAVGVATTALALGGLATLLALPSAPLLLIVAAAGTAAAAVLGRQGRCAEAVVGGDLATSLQLAATTVGLLATIGGGAELYAVGVMLVTGMHALARPRVAAECGAITASLVLLPVSLDAVDDSTTQLAIWLSVAGALVSASALLHPQRRVVAPLGGVLLLLATWVRLADLGVEAPEAYTLPLAGVLVALGLHRMQVAGTASLTALLPGLLLATTPSLLWVLVDPVSLRALLLGAGCLALVVGGAALRWSAPLVVGAGVGAVLVLRALGPYAGSVPTWAWIGLAGLTLTVLGTTWERRLAQAGDAWSALERLR